MLLSEQQRISSSVLSFVAFICHGFYVCALGASIPEMSTILNISVARLSILFTARGFGFMLGTVLCSYFIKFYSNSFQKEFLISLIVLFAGIASLGLIFSRHLGVIATIIFFQGSLYAGLDILCNILLPQIWEVRSQVYLHTISFY